MEFVLAQHDEFQYDYQNGRLIPKSAIRYPVYSEMVDKPNPVFQILHISRKVKSYSEAVELLHAITVKEVQQPVLC